MGVVLEPTVKCRQQTGRARMPQSANFATFSSLLAFSLTTQREKKEKVGLLLNGCVNFIRSDEESWQHEFLHKGYNLFKWPAIPGLTYWTVVTAWVSRIAGIPSRVWPGSLVLL
jgi:hypothetical protein